MPPLFRAAALAALIAAPFAAPAGATDLASMTEEERAAFGAEVRAYLMENPEVLMEAIGELEKRQAQAQSAGDAQMLAAHSDEIFEDGHSWVGGNPEGDVTVVEFLDYRCGFCKRAHPDVADLIEKDGNIRLIVKEFPILGEQSVIGSHFALSVLRTEGDAAYHKVNDALMSMRTDITEDSLRGLADSLELDTDAVMEGMTAPEIATIIDENRKLGQALQINGTPTFIFGDRMVRGYVELDAMRQIVEDLREG